MHLSENRSEELFIEKVKFHRNQTSAPTLFNQEIEINGFNAEILMPEEGLISCAEKISGENFDVSDENLIAELTQIF